MSSSPLLIITLGDPFSINIEAIEALLPDIPVDQRTVLLGSWGQWSYQARNKDRSQFKFIRSWEEVSEGLHFWDLDQNKASTDPKLLSPLERGTMAVNPLETLRTLPNPRDMAVLTCPIDKYACHEAGFKFPGQTEFFEDLAGEQGIMILSGPKLKVGLVTNHLALRDVSSKISQELIQKKFRLMHHALKSIYKKPQTKITITGLNPHCGDQGMFGNEDREIITPAVDGLKTEFDDDVNGPAPADTAFFRCYQGDCDGVLAMHHDQGLGPLKTVHFYDAVNITGGLPFLRVSPDHGPASDKYGTGEANLLSFREALNHCLRYLGHG